MHASQPETRDDELVRASQSGSREAFGSLVVRHARAVRALCLARVGVVADLDDMVQEVFLRAFQGLARLVEPGAFGGYLHRIAQNLCIDRVRRKSKSAVSLESVELDPPAPVAAEEDERLAKLRRAVGRLPEALREALLLFYIEERSAAEMAECLGITEASVNQRLHRARTQLRETFGVGKESST